MNRIYKKFLNLKKRKKTALIAYLTVGYPDIATTERLIIDLSKNGVDMFELGMPFSDPLADGPIIQESSNFALNHKINLDSIFSLTKRLNVKIDSPLLMMGYYNPILKYGLNRFAKKVKASGLDGIIVPDLPIEESNYLNRQLIKNKIHLINFIAPTTDKKRVKKIATQSKGFIYYVSLTGVTGARKSLPKDVATHVKQLKKISKIPICVGFGVSKKSQFESLSRFSDGVIVGSAIIKKIKDNLGKNNLIQKVSSFIHSLKSST